MLVKEVVEKLGLSVFSGEEALEKPVTGGVVSDILSDVMAQAHKGELWVTNQTHENVLAIVFFKGLAGVILPGGHRLDDDAAKKALEKHIPVFLTDLSTFEVVGRLYELGVGRM
ncbi:MAG: DRTGG domain-containing protein [candidate division KSB1 bacterium]|nr:DRTGG domain-containing protein [candidate division KSB1 bacterium]MDZ7345489.1 DRTGG domain-containing protein [candidate division KSB1 bacterium]